MEQPNSYKLSFFNHYISKNGVNLIFNSLSGSLIRFNDNNFSSLRLLKFDSFTPSEISQLINARILTNLTDEFEYVISQRKQIESKDDVFRLTIFTTTHCNARCEYCFEKNTHKINPSYEVEAKIIEILKKHHNNQIHIKWFGGEPLLNPGMIDRISQFLRSQKINFSASMISNGYFAGIFAKKMKTWNIKVVQITLDGINDVYNKTKRYINRNDPNPFETVINGIKKLLDNNIKVSVRLNFDRNNYLDILDCIRYLHEEFGNQKNFSIYCHHIFGPSSNYHLDDGTNIYLLIVGELIKYGYVNSLFRLGLRYRPLPCSAYSRNFYAITPDGKMYKCEHFKNDKDFPGVVGNIFDGIINKENFEFWVNRDLPYEKCYKCKFLPLCEGGCKFESLENYPDGACLPYRDCIDDLIISYYFKIIGK